MIARSRGAPLRCVRVCVVHYMGVADGTLVYVGTNEGFQCRRAGHRVNVLISGLPANCPDQIGTVGRHVTKAHLQSGGDLRSKKVWILLLLKQ